MENEIIKRKGNGMPKFIISDEENTKSSFYWPTKCNLGDTILFSIVNQNPDLEITESQIEDTLRTTISKVHYAFRYALTFLFVSIQNPESSIHCLIWVKWTNPDRDEVEIEICKQEKHIITETYKINWNVVT